MAGGQRPKGLNKSCVLLIVIAGIERFAYKGVASNLVTYLTDVVKMSNSSAAKTVNSWCGFTSMLPLLVAPIAESYWERHFTILAFSFLYVLGLVALTSTALVWAEVPANESISSSTLIWCLYLISLGQGGYNPSLQTFGAEQLEGEEDLPCNNKDEQNPSKKSLFFQWWYFGICSGSLLGVSLMSYVQDTIGWGLGFAIPTIAMVSSTVFFLCGSQFYVYKPREDVDARVLENIAQAIKLVASKIRNVGIALSNYKVANTIEIELEDKPLCRQSPESIEALDEKSTGRSTLLMENIKAVLRLIPVWTTLLTFAIIFQQPATFFTKQGMTMKRNIGKSIMIPPATLQSAITISIILLMPLYDKILIPFTSMITGKEKGISVMQRMGIGMALSIIAMVIAATTENKRLHRCKEMETSDLSIFWLLPQYILLGVSDIFTVVGMQEFFYTEVPTRMRTTGIALYTSVFGVGSFMSALLISVIEVFTGSKEGSRGWFSDDMREARLDKYYWLLAFASALSLLLFVILGKCYKKRGDLDNETRK
ncbi:Proton-dependent oligopeptide transporter family [Dillenia turbinata]|uniref:Proton-dependent oligopeptide transporter family n=1 Tax=Dillenia turbinata TaxID=194707 RepID=A0AAN8YUR8_9MAGN